VIDKIRQNPWQVNLFLQSRSNTANHPPLENGFSPLAAADCRRSVCPVNIKNILEAISKRHFIR
jgi:hypothetical protein